MIHMANNTYLKIHLESFLKNSKPNLRTYSKINNKREGPCLKNQRIKHCLSQREEVLKAQKGI